MKKQVIIILILLLLFVALFAGCTAKKSLAPPDIIGEVLEVEEGNMLRVLVDAVNGDIKGQIWVTINDKTTFLENIGGRKLDIKNRASFFRVGNNISILSNGEIMESYPMQTTALCVYQK